MLPKKVEPPQLQDAVGALRVRAQMDGIAFTEWTYHLSAIVSESSLCNRLRVAGSSDLEEDLGNRIQVSRRGRQTHSLLGTIREQRRVQTQRY